jgi:poly(A) polymerase
MFIFYEVGGKVRDELLGLQSKDIDYVAVPDNEEICSGNIGYIFQTLSMHLEREGYQIFLETPDCYTIRAKFPKGHKHEGIVADFVLARREIGYKEGTREPIVVPGTLYDDLQRRDFTVNAIAKDANGNLIDPFGGQLDLQKKLLRTPIAGQITFEDDPLRLLRALRFAVTKGFTISVPIYRTLRSFDYETKFAVVSEERIREELHKAFKADTLRTLTMLEVFHKLKDYIFKYTNLWLKPTNEQ